MSFVTNQLPEAFQEDHGTDEAELPAITAEEEHERYDEVLEMDGLEQRVWLVKIPKFLMERWSSVEKEGVELGRVRVYDAKDSNGDPKISVLLAASDDVPPPAPAVPTPAASSKGKGRQSIVKRPTAVPTEYKLTLQNTATKNMFIFGEKEEDIEETGEEGARKRRRITTMLGTIHHECALTPSLSSVGASSSYSSIMRQRQKKAAEPKRTLKMLDVDEGTANRLASGVGLSGLKTNKASTFVVTKKSKAKTINQRAERLPLNELYDLLFTYFGQSPYWTLKSLKEHINQPEVYLRTSLSEIGTLLRAGPYSGMWTLKEMFRGEEGRKRVKVEERTVAVKAEEEGEPVADPAVEEEEEEEDEEMDLVA